VVSGSQKGGKMSDQKICWRCRDYLKQKYGANFYSAPSNHCHHGEPEEEPKPKCEWCENYSLIKDAFQGTPTGHVIDFLIAGSSKNPLKCPVCDKKL
jgi:hypothetical protein